MTRLNSRLMIGSIRMVSRRKRLRIRKHGWTRMKRKLMVKVRKLRKYRNKGIASEIDHKG